MRWRAPDVQRELLQSAAEPSAYAIPTTSFLNVFRSSAVTLKAEFRHYDLGASGILVANPATGNSYTSQIKTQGNLVRAGIDCKFDFFSGAPAPVVARY